MSYQVKQSSTEVALVFLLVGNSDHITGLTGATPTVTISKAGGAFASPSGAVSEIGNGWYKVAANATDSNTLGPLILHASATSSDPADPLFEVVAYDPQATSLGLTLAKTTNITGFNDIAATAIVSSGAITTSSGAVSSVTTVSTLTTYTGNTPQTGDSYARLGAPSGASIDADILSRLATSGYTTPPTAAAIATAVWTDNTTGSDFSGGLHSIGQQILYVVGITASAGQIAQAVWVDTPASGDFGNSGSIGYKLWNSASQSGDSYARLGAPSGASIDADILSRLATSGYTTPPTTTAIAAAIAAGSVGSVTGNVGGNVVGSTASVTGAVGSVTAAVSLSLTQTLSAARALDAIADTSLTLNDALHCAIAGAAGKESITGTSYVIETPYTATVLRTFTLNSSTSPTSRT